MTVAGRANIITDGGGVKNDGITMLGERVNIRGSSAEN